MRYRTVTMTHYGFKEDLPAHMTACRLTDRSLPGIFDRRGQDYSRQASFSKEYYFFYGTLMDPKTLRKVLNLAEQRQLLPSKVLGYRCMLWGEYPALVQGSLNEPVHGMACEVQSSEEVKLLKSYETENYENFGCIIQFEDGTEAVGRTFVWAGDRGDLREGWFDLKDWKLNDLERNLTRGNG